MATLTLQSATVAPNGRLLKLIFRVAPIPASHALPDWRTGYAAGLRLTISSGATLEFAGAIAEVADYGQPDVEGRFTNTGGLLPVGTYQIASSISRISDGVEEQLSAIGMFQVPAAGNLSILNQIYGKTVPTGYTGNIYISPNGGDQTSLVLYRGGLAAGTTSFHLDTDVWDNPSQHFPGYTALKWEVTYTIPDANQIVTYGQTGLTISAGAGLIADRLGNTTGAIVAAAVTNRSLCQANGFTSQAIPRGTGGVTLYVSDSHGVDTGNNTTDYSAGQNPATPLKTIARALALMKLAGNAQNAKGAAIRLLQGDTWTLTAIVGFELGGQDPTHPFIFEDYWYDFSGTGLPAPGIRPIVQSNQLTLFLNNGGGPYRPQSNVLIRRIAFKQTNLTDPGATKAFDQSMDGDDWTFDDCSFERFQTNILMQAGYENFHRVTIHRCIIKDSFHPGDPHSQGCFLPNCLDLVISQNCVDTCGRKSADLTAADIFSHNFYLSLSVVKPVFWGNLIRQGGSHGAQMRSGGIAAYNVYSGNAIAAFSRHPGGWFTRNVIEKGRDIVENTGVVKPRGSGIDAFGEVTPSYQGCRPIGIGHEFNIFVNCNGGDPYAQQVNHDPEVGIETLVVRNNTAHAHGVGLRYSGTPPVPSTAILHHFDANIYSSGNERVLYIFDIPASYSWLQSDRNVIVSTLASGNQTRIGTTDRSLATYKSMTGTEANSITTAPTFVDSAADMGTYYGTLGGTATEAAFVDHLRTRPPGTWDATYDPSLIWAFYAAQYTPTNYASLGSGTWDYYGASDYRLIPPPARHRSLRYQMGGGRARARAVG